MMTLWASAAILAAAPSAQADLDRLAATLGYRYTILTNRPVSCPTGTPPPPSFAADVKPFMTMHCRSCHATGASYAPVMDLENYSVAKAWASQTIRRLTDTSAPMPPANREVLTPAQYDVVVRWAEGGLLP